MERAANICIIDDDEVYQFTATHTIKGLGIAQKILVFSDGEDAFEFLNNNITDAGALPDVIFLDIRMPYMDGWAFVEEYAELKPRLPKHISIYMVSSSIDEDDLSKAKSINEISDYIVKPTNAREFKELIQNLPLGG